MSSLKSERVDTDFPKPSSSTESEELVIVTVPAIDLHMNCCPSPVILVKVTVYWSTGRLSIGWDMTIVAEVAVTDDVTTGASNSSGKVYIHHVINILDIY